MSPAICYRDVTHRLHRRRRQLPIAEDAEEVMTTSRTGSGGGMSVASGRARASTASSVTSKNQRILAVRKNAAVVRRRLRRGVAWSLHEIEDSRISTTTSVDSGAMVNKYRRHYHNQGDEDAESTGDETMESTAESRVEGLMEYYPEGRQQHQKKKQQGNRSTLLGITMRTMELIRRNQLLQWRLSLLQEETRAFVKSVMSNPENRKVEEGDGKGRGGSSLEDGAQDPSVSGSC